MPSRPLDRAAESGFTLFMNFTLFGYSKSGKTTLFNLLTGAHEHTAGFDEGKREAHLRTVSFPDDRLARLAAVYPEKKAVSWSIDLLDLAGLSFGEVKNSTLLSHLRKSDLLVHTVRGFTDPLIPHPKGRVSPREDILSMEQELILADLVSVEARLEKLELDLKKKKDPEAEKEREVLAALRPALEEGKAVRETELGPAEEKAIRGFAFLSQKPLLHIVNLAESDTSSLEKPESLAPPARKGIAVLAFCGRIEGEISELSAEDKAAFIAEYGLKELTSPKFFRFARSLLDMILFYTVGKDEVRAWAVKRGSPAQKAAGVIHTDMEKGFIRAEVVHLDDLLRLGSLQHAKEKGAIRLEGKDYPVLDGDVIYFRFTS